MLSAITIKNFRLFEKLEVKRLGRVTLLVGKNNSGKSSFLEALLLYLNMPSEFILIYLLRLRQELGKVSSENNKYLFPVAVKHLFHRHRLPEREKKGIFLKVNSENEGWRELHIFIEEQGMGNEKETKGFSQYVLEARMSSKRFSVWPKHFKKDYSLPLGTYNLSGIQEASDLYQFDFSCNNIRFVTTDGISDWVASKMWGEIVLTDIEEKIISVLKMLEPSIMRVAFVEDQEKNEIELLPIVKIENLDETIALRSMGEGVTKLFHILISIANAKDGTLLIDEFENGFHWSVQEKVWTAVFELAEKLNVQVFATTHSRDCVQAFSKVWSKNEEAGAFIRLENDEGVVRAQEYHPEILADSIETNVEVR